MTRYVGLLRAVNVGGTGRLPMAELTAMCRDAGFARIETYIASGNVVFDADAPAAAVRAALEKRLAAYAGKPVAVLLRTADALHDVLHAIPFAGTDPRHTYVIFLDARPPGDTLARLTGRTDEDVRLGAREIFVHYPSGMGRSRLKIPTARDGTARNVNTVAKLVEIARRD